MKRYLTVAILATSTAWSSHASAQVATAPAASDDAGPSAFEFRVGGYYVNGERNYYFQSSAQTATGNLQGFEGLLRGSGIGLSVRYYDGQFGNQPDLVSADANVLLGSRVFSLEAGGSRRALTSSLGSTVYTFGRAGVRMEWLVGGTGLTTVLKGAYYVPAGTSSGPGTGDMQNGMEGEAGLIYNFRAAPIYIQVGYRSEVFTAKTSTTQIPEEVRGLRLGGGLQFGGK